MNEEKSGRYLSFELGGGQYAVEVERVEVVLEMVPITRVPKAPAHLKGVINYRGAVIPVADLSERFGKSGLAAKAKAEAAPAAPTAPADRPAPEARGEGSPEEGRGSIIVLQVQYGSEEITMGVLADAVREVVDIDPGHIERAPRLGGKREDRLIAGIGEKDGRFIIILDVDAAFAADSDFARPADRKAAETVA